MPGLPRGIIDGRTREHIMSRFLRRFARRRIALYPVLLSTGRSESRITLQWPAGITRYVRNPTELIFTKMGLTERIYFQLKGGY